MLTSEAEGTGLERRPNVPAIVVVQDKCGVIANSQLGLFIKAGKLLPQHARRNRVDHSEVGIWMTNSTSGYQPSVGSKSAGHSPVVRSISAWSNRTTLTIRAGSSFPNSKLSLSPCSKNVTAGQAAVAPQRTCGLRNERGDCDCFHIAVYVSAPPKLSVWYPQTDHSGVTSRTRPSSGASS